MPEQLPGKFYKVSELYRLSGQARATADAEIAEFVSPAYDWECNQLTAKLNECLDRMGFDQLEVTWSSRKGYRAAGRCRLGGVVDIDTLLMFDMQPHLVALNCGNCLELLNEADPELFDRPAALISTYLNVRRLYRCRSVRLLLSARCDAASTEQLKAIVATEVLYANGNVRMSAGLSPRLRSLTQIADTLCRTRMTQLLLAFQGCFSRLNDRFSDRKWLESLLSACRFDHLGRLWLPKIEE